MHNYFNIIKEYQLKIDYECEFDEENENITDEVIYYSVFSQKIGGYWYSGNTLESAIDNFIEGEKL